jgi:hypothetical protein
MRMRYRELPSKTAASIDTTKLVLADKKSYLQDIPGKLAADPMGITSYGEPHPTGMYVRGSFVAIQVMLGFAQARTMPDDGDIDRLRAIILVAIRRGLSSNRPPSSIKEYSFFKDFSASHTQISSNYSTLCLLHQHTCALRARTWSMPSLFLALLAFCTLTFRIDVVPGD